MRVEVSPEWREAERLSCEQVFTQVVTSCKCCHPDMPTYELTCKICRSGGGGVVEITQVQTPVRVCNGKEQYLFEVRGLCTSSRRHLHTQNVRLAVTLGHLQIVSELLTLVSRLKDRRRKGGSAVAQPRRTRQELTVAAEPRFRALPVAIPKLLLTPFPVMVRIFQHAPQFKPSMAEANLLQNPRGPGLLCRRGFVLQPPDPTGSYLYALITKHDSVASMRTSLRLVQDYAANCYPNAQNVNLLALGLSKLLAVATNL
eukprot:TRINITY_DN4439_c0_g1_i1.p1 TRINITY_DN4439_c0_g1~~TRINITY_DN4439_c0_g1_i1.p1  ORF type:complete len:299 (+),score=46.01 TRINITY_DN4439_c0_g1_i1:125-898(+)